LFGLNSGQQGTGLRAKIDKPHMLIKGFQRYRFGKRSKQLNAKQMQLAIEDLEWTWAPVWSRAKRGLRPKPGFHSLRRQPPTQSAQSRPVSGIANAL
jgi:hypothetical protein